MSFEHAKTSAKAVCEHRLHVPGRLLSFTARGTVMSWARRDPCKYLMHFWKGGGDIGAAPAPSADNRAFAGAFTLCANPSIAK